MMLLSMAIANGQRPAVVEAHCPNCGHITLFRYAGEQKCPPQVAELLGLPTSISLWHCDNCNSTLSEIDLGG
jgi:RNase P subunit RPR2